jgi:hypothetical protein
MTRLTWRRRSRIARGSREDVSGFALRMKCDAVKFAMKGFSYVTLSPALFIDYSRYRL